jgi:hypothetical protein
VDVQTRLFASVLDEIETMPDLINWIVEVYSDGSVEVRLADGHGRARHALLIQIQWG